jgi:lipopolysaccharide biosynthesis protein
VSSLGTGPYQASARAQLVAFYLPQFHPIPENDEWWGTGFTEWTNVRRAQPWFPGHRQPRIPGLLGYYDLRDPTVYSVQQDLARQYGVSAFCYYAYWFGGRRLLELPLKIVSDNRDLTLPYCICWANENWTRSWDGLQDGILIQQQHEIQTDIGIIDDLALHLSDERYLRIDGRPLLIIYRPMLITNPAKTTDALRQRAGELGLGELHLSMVQVGGTWDPRGLGFDSAIEFPPHNADSRLFTVTPSNPRYPATPGSEWRGRVYSYPAVVDWAMSKPVPDFTWFRGVMPGWDNTPRRRSDGVVFLDDSPEVFQAWLERTLHYTYLFHPPGHRMLFINSWNEWAEGAYIEPDLEDDNAKLTAIQNALTNTDDLACSTSRAHASNSELLRAAQTYFRSSAFLTREVLALWSERDPGISNYPSL